MVCEELLGELVKCQMHQKGNPDVLRVNPDYYRMLLEQLAYPEWLIKRKMNTVNQTLLGINVEITGEIKRFELQKYKKLAES
ncbi:hypothetical protein AAIE21_01085 [Paenibacillus sp. 102]|uniref:hypothetical protein n=1 Tax=Paenibacillus sp. 102 TaxID=3120823 RepID=UPI0031BBC021